MKFVKDFNEYYEWYESDGAIWIVADIYRYKETGAGIYYEDEDFVYQILVHEEHGELVYAVIDGADEFVSNDVLAGMYDALYAIGSNRKYTEYDADRNNPDSDRIGAWRCTTADKKYTLYARSSVERCEHQKDRSLARHRATLQLAEMFRVLKAC